MLASYEYISPSFLTEELLPALRIEADGAWYYGDTQLQRIGLVQLFYTVLNKQPDGYFLTTPVENVRVDVLDAPYAVIGLQQVTDANGNEGFNFILNDDSIIRFDAARPVWFDDRGVAYVCVRHDRHGESLNARIALSVFLQLVDHATVQPDGRYCVQSFNDEIVLGEAAQI